LTKKIKEAIKNTSKALMWLPTPNPQEAYTGIR